MKKPIQVIQEYFAEARANTTSNERAFEMACDKFEQLHNLRVPFSYDSFRQRKKSREKL